VSVFSWAKEEMSVKKLPLVSNLALAAMSAQARAQTAAIATPGIKAIGVSKADLKDVFTGARSSLVTARESIPLIEVFA
jgi:hypothetical protein